ncbi:MAG: YlxR family protein [Bacillota bacterium]
MKRQRVPLRRCVACGQVRPKKELVRVVRTPEGQVMVDGSRSGKLPGRGAYLCPELSCLERAIDSRALERSLECEISSQARAALMERFGTGAGGKELST